MQQIVAMDIGNTRTKLGVFAPDGRLLQRQVLSHDQAAHWLHALLEQRPGKTAIGWLSTSSEWEEVQWAPILDLPEVQVHHIHPGISWPFAHRYTTPHTLGADRFAAIVAACNLCRNAPVLVVDAGTAITYDVATAEPTYLGGAISPGIQMRYDALSHFTARLPQLKASGDPPLVGDSTTNSLRAGVEYAAVKEVAGMIDDYRREMGETLQVFLTGGDADYFEKQLKNVNFADASLVLRGIYFIIKQIASI